MGSVSYITVSSAVNCPSFVTEDGEIGHCFCMEPLATKETVAHNQEGSDKLWHPVHKACLARWQETEPNGGCPECRAQILVPLKERVINEVKLGLKDGVLGAIVGSVGLLTPGLLYSIQSFGPEGTLGISIVGAIAGGILINRSEEDLVNQDIQVSPAALTGAILTGGVLMGGIVLGGSGGLLAGGLAAVTGGIFGAALGGNLERNKILPL